jgi:DDE superfamily endonuclease
MKKFLLKDPLNRAWVEGQEKQHASTIQSNAALKEIRSALYPELQLTHKALSKQSTTPGIKIMARQRQLMRNVLNELKTRFPCDSDEEDSPKGRRTLQRNRTNSWHRKSQGLYFYFHPDLGHKNTELTCMTFGFNCATFINWITQSTYYPKWLPFVTGFTFADIINEIPMEHRAKYTHVLLESKVDVPTKYQHNKTNKTYTAAPGDGTRQMKRKTASRSEGVIYITKTAKSVGGGRHIKYKEEADFLMDAVVVAWETGNPLSRSSCYNLLLTKFGPDLDRAWTSQMDITSGQISPALSQWLTRTLQRHDYAVRKESISQTVPANWFTLALDACEFIRSTMSKASVTRLVNMDEMFLNYYPKDTHLIVPVNTKRVGANRKEDAKKGCTVAVSCEMYSSELLAPFVVMDGTTDGYLARRYAHWCGNAEVKFQARHWMDGPVAITYLDWLKGCFPNDRIGLIWDFATAHKADDVLGHARELDITVAFIPAGLTSILQVCDLIVNKPIKAAFKRSYCAFKMRNDPGPGGKYVVDRDDVLVWIEEAMKEVNKSQAARNGIGHAFRKYGQDPRCEDTTELLECLTSLQENRIYASLLENQAALDLEEI